MTLPKTPALTTDCVVFDPDKRVLLIRRKNAPHAGTYALPGGFVDIGETVEVACRREVLEETGVEVEELRLVGVYSDPNRDSRGHTVSIAFTAVLASRQNPKAGSDADGAEWCEDWRTKSVGFDHAKIIGDAEDLLANRPNERP